MFSHLCLYLLYFAGGASLPNTEVVQGDGGVEVVCYDFCRFADGTKNKKWTCNDRLLDYAEGCICPGKLRNQNYYYFGLRSMVQLSKRATHRQYCFIIDVTIFVVMSKHKTALYWYGLIPILALLCI